MFDNLDLNNLKIRTKLIGVLALPVIALLLFAFIGYGQRNRTARQATTDSHIIAAADATSDLVTAMQQETAAMVIQVATKKPSAGVADLERATDQAYEAFTKANKKVDMKGGSPAASEARSALAGLPQSIDGFKTNRNQLAGLTAANESSYTDWSNLLTNMTGGIEPFVQYIPALAALTTTPEVDLPLEQLGALLDYNTQTMGLSAMAVATASRASDGWEEDKTPRAPSTSDKDYRELANTSNQELVYQAAIGQDRANAVMSALISGTSTTKSYFTKNVQRASDLDTVLSGDWKLPDALNGTPFSAAVGDMDPPSVTPTLADVQSYVKQLGGAASDLNAQTADRIHAARSDAVRSARLYLLGGGLVIVLALAGAIWISRSITQRLVKLTGAADRLSHEQLPRLVDSLKNPADDDVGYLTSSFTEIDVSGSDEIGQLAGAFNRIQGVAVDVATEQAQLLRKGIGDMFVNLARRNQSLLDRQIEFIDQLEAAEEDPDQLENLFRLDHLATRMRRNAESLLVLAGAEPSRRRGKPVPLADVVRAAVGEVEDFARIDMLQFDEVLVASNAALDIAHLLSELMENAANFSPPDTRVEVVGHRTKAEGYVISVTDHGIGMSAEALAEANDQLARPPLVGLALSRSLGFIVIGRLAARFGIAVRLMPSPTSGTTAMVSLPPTLITDQPKSAIEPPSPVAPEAIGSSAPPPGRDPSQGGPADGQSRPPSATGAPSVSRSGPTTGTMPRRKAAPVSGRTPSAGNGDTPSTARGGRAAPDGVLSKPVPAAPAPDGAASGSVATSSGLTKRVPRSAGAQRAVPGGDGQRSATQNRRSPEEVRSMLSRYRSGMQKGRDDEPTPDAPAAAADDAATRQPPKAKATRTRAPKARTPKTDSPKAESPKAESPKDSGK